MACDTSQGTDSQKAPIMKSDHLKKVEARAERVKQLLLPLAVKRGEVTDPQDRLRELILRVGGRGVLPGDFPLRTAVADVVRFLEVDVPEMLQAVRDAQREVQEARRALLNRVGDRYRLVITSDAPLAVQVSDVLPAEAADREGG